MKRLVSKRMLKRVCGKCGKHFLKGQVYYKVRIVAEEYGEVSSYEYLLCPKCKYKLEQHNQRYKKFQEHCEHPKEFIEEIWSYIPGECVKQPDHLECRLCGEWI